MGFFYPVNPLNSLRKISYICSFDDIQNILFVPPMMVLQTTTTTSTTTSTTTTSTSTSTTTTTSTSTTTRTRSLRLSGADVRYER